MCTLHSHSVILLVHTIFHRLFTDTCTCSHTHTHTHLFIVYWIESEFTISLYAITFRPFRYFWLFFFPFLCLCVLNEFYSFSKQFKCNVVIQREIEYIRVNRQTERERTTYSCNWQTKTNQSTTDEYWNDSMWCCLTAIATGVLLFTIIHTQTHTHTPTNTNATHTT